MRRGEIWTATGSGLASKPRPVVIVQDDLFGDTATVTVCLITSDPIDAPLLRIPVAPSTTNGLREPSRLMVDKLMTTRRDRLGQRLGALEREQLLALERGLAVFLGLGS